MKNASPLAMDPTAPTCYRGGSAATEEGALSMNLARLLPLVAMLVALSPPPASGQALDFSGWTSCQPSEDRSGGRVSWSIGPVEAAKGGSRPILLLFIMIEHPDPTATKIWSPTVYRLHGGFAYNAFDMASVALLGEFERFYVDLSRCDAPASVLSRWGVKHNPSYAGPNPRLFVLDNEGTPVFATANHDIGHGVMARHMKNAMARTERNLARRRRGQ